MLSLLCLDFGRAPFYYIFVTNVARAGAGYASSNPYPFDATAQTAWKTKVTIPPMANAVSANSGLLPWYNSANLSFTSSSTTHDQLRFHQ